MKRNFTKFAFAIAAMAALAPSCAKEEIADLYPNWDDSYGETAINIMWSESAATSSTTGTYIQALTVEELEDASNMITFVGKGYELESQRTAYANAEGGYLYNFSYGGGSFVKYAIGGNSYYKQTGASVAMGTAAGSNNCRVSLIENNTVASGHNVTTANVSEGDVYQTTNATLSVALASLSSMSITTQSSGLIPTTETDNDMPAYAWRVHYPYSKTIGGDKVTFYGVARRRLVAEDLSTDSDYDATAAVLVVKNDDLDNIAVMEAPSFGGVRTIGQTYGYRTNPFFEDENGDIYHVTMNNLRILKISGSTGEYDSSFDFDLKSKISGSIAAGSEGLDGTGIYYVGNGIAYVPYEDNNLDDSNTYKWGVARVDLYNSTAVAMSGLPSNLNMWSYQQAKVVGDKLYMALCGYGQGLGYIYIFDSTSTAADGYSKGAKLINSGEAYYSSLF
ncbi:MAG: hypothetical protein SNH79_03155 [Rikenellaceae bacterium]